MKKKKNHKNKSRNTDYFWWISQAFYLHFANKAKQKNPWKRTNNKSRQKREKFKMIFHFQLSCHVKNIREWCGKVDVRHTITVTKMFFFSLSLSLYYHCNLQIFSDYFMPCSIATYIIRKLRKSSLPESHISMFIINTHILLSHIAIQSNRCK